MSSPLSPLLSPVVGANGALQLLTETDPASEMIRLSSVCAGHEPGRIPVGLVDCRQSAGSPPPSWSRADNPLVCGA
jgi:hypothetical protein